MIIRGGENVSAREVEELVATLPGVAEVSVVAAPDERMGERAAAVLHLRPGETAPTLDEVRRHLDGAGLARQKWPESLHVVEELPRTPSGKVQKFVLRERLRRTRPRENEERTMPRLDPIPAGVAAEMRTLAALVPPKLATRCPSGADRPKGLNVLGTLAHHPQLTAAYHVQRHVQFATTLSQRQRR